LPISSPLLKIYRGNRYHRTPIESHSVERIPPPRPLITSG